MGCPDNECQLNVADAPLGSVTASSRRVPSDDRIPPSSVFLLVFLTFWPRAHSTYIMSAKAITEYDGKRLLAKWLLDPTTSAATSSATASSSSSPSSSVVVESSAFGPLSFVPATKLARVELEAVAMAATTGAGYKPSADVEPPVVASLSSDRGSVDVSAQLASLFAQLERSEPWLLTDRLVVKPDQLIKRRGKLGLLGINLDWNQVKLWIQERAGKEIQVWPQMLVTGEERLTHPSSLLGGLCSWYAQILHHRTIRTASPRNGTLHLYPGSA